MSDNSSNNFLFCGYDFLYGKVGRGEEGDARMKTGTELRRRFHEIPVEIERFILEESSLTPIEGSNKVVSVGAYTWTKLSDASRQQQRLCTRYLQLIDSVDRDNLDEESLNRFTCSRDRVLSLLKQDSVVLQDTNEKVYEDITEELKLQAWLSEGL